jgi:ribosomal protein L11 methyltransferase
MFSLEIECDPDDRDLLIAELWEQGSAGIVELDARRVRAFFDEEHGRDSLLRLYPGAGLRVEEERDWVQSARDLLQPMEVGKRFFLAPEWRDDPAPPGRFRMTVNPGMAFGTGVHETTQLSLEALEEFCAPGTVVLDVGTGSGILAQASRLLGAGRVLACDTDPVAVEIAREGFVGSVDAVAAASVDLVVANISPGAIVCLAPELRRVLRADGTLLVSGFEIQEVGDVQRALGVAGDIRQKNTWALLAARVP